MSFFANNNLIEIRSGNALVFSTDRKMPAITSEVQGNLTLPARGNSSPTAVNHWIANVPFSPEFVMSTSRITGGSAYPWVNFSFNSSGSIVTNLGWNITDTWRLAACRTLTFFTNGGSLFIREHFYNTFPSLQLASFNLSFRVYLGSFV